MKRGKVKSASLREARLYNEGVFQSMCKYGWLSSNPSALDKKERTVHSMSTRDSFS